MAGDDSSRDGVPFFVIGVLAILLGLLANEFFIEFAFSGDSDLAPSSRWKVRLMMLVLVGFGSLLIVARVRLGVGARAVLGRYPNVSALVLGSGVALAGLLAIEGAFYALQTIQTRQRGWVEVSPFFQPGETTTASLSVHGERVFDVSYTLNEDYARVTPTGADAPSNNELYFFGGSFTFGQGVEDDETLPYAVAVAAPDWHVTNFGFPGHGPSQMLKRLEGGPLTGLESAESVKLVYSFIPGHVRRALGSMRIATAWGREFPCYELSAQGDLISCGTFIDGRPTLFSIYRLLSRESILRFFEVDVPLQIQPNHLELTARIIEESRDTLRAQFSDAEFVVLLYPDHPGDEFDSRELIPLLDAAEIRYLDYTDLFQNDDEYWLPHDLHPTAKAHAQLGTHVSKDLELN